MNKFEKNPWEWTDEEVIAACVDLPTRSSIWKTNQSAYVCIAYRNLWSKLPWLRDRRSDRRRRLTDQDIIERSMDFKGDGRGSFQRHEPALYAAAYRRGLLDRMPWLDDPEGRTTNELIALSQKYTTYADFKKNEPGAYMTLRKRGVIESLVFADDDVPDWLTEERKAREAELKDPDAGGSVSVVVPTAPPSPENASVS